MTETAVDSQQPTDLKHISDEYDKTTIGELIDKSMIKLYTKNSDSDTYDLVTSERLRTLEETTELYTDDASLEMIPKKGGRRRRSSLRKKRNGKKTAKRGGKRKKNQKSKRRH